MALLESIMKSDKPKERGAGFAITMVHYTKLMPSEDNNYSVEKIKELANMILLSGGVKQNLLARKKTPDEYELIAGHRRRLAVKYLVEELGMAEFAMMPVHIEKSGDLLSEIDLILTNCGARERSDWEKMMEVSRLTELMKAMQTGSDEEKGRFRRLFGREPGISGRELRKAVSEALGLSETKVANLNHINSNLIPELKDRFRDGDIGVSVANEAASLPAEKQEALSRQEEIKIADAKAQKSVSDSDTECYPDNPEIRCENGSEEEGGPVATSQEQMEPRIRDAYCDAAARKFIKAFHDWMQADFPNRVMNVTESEKQFKERFRISCTIWCFEAPDGTGVAHVDLFDDYVQFWSGKAGECIGNCEWFYLCSAVQRMWNVIALEKAKAERNSPEIPEKVPETEENVQEMPISEPEPTIDDIDLSVEAYNCLNRAGITKLSEIRDMSDSELSRVRGLGARAFQQVRKLVGEFYSKDDSVVDAEFSEVPAAEYDSRILNKMIADAENALGVMQEYWRENQPQTYTKHVMELQAYKDLLVRHENAEEEPEPVEQPELPLLKNNDQRKKWLRNYRDWGVWYEDEHIGVKYYKYDFENGARLIAEEYEGELPGGMPFISNYLHLVGGPKDGSTYHSKYYRFPDCETDLMEFLKELQRKGEGR
ncbi:MAG: DNA-directed RNA polymerase subunit alpha C-terminal domain-containing protein [Eubacteriales bacterium]|nr:DNA-directed RNA polymerase subunit alpha C-terminal domain-containing protein [Eubacteriales bacterium]